MRREVFLDANGKRRVIVSGSDDVGFTFHEERFSEDPSELCWLPQTYRTSAPRCATYEIALAEAQGRIAWFSEAVEAQPTVQADAAAQRGLT